MKEHTNSDMTALQVVADQKGEELENLSALGYTYLDMAMYFAVDDALFIDAASDPSSRIYYHIKRGLITASFDEGRSLLNDAKAGNITASQRLSQIRRERGFEITKLDVFGGFADKERLQKLENYVMNGSRDSLTNDEVLYIELLTQFHSMDRQFGRRNTIAFFTKPPFSFPYGKAREMYDEAQNLFYTDRNIDKKALRNKKSEQLEEAARQVMLNAKCSKDWEIYANILDKAAKLQELDKADIVKLPRQAYMSPIRIYSLNPMSVGIPAINRHEVSSQIDMLEISESHKRSMRRDAMIEDVNIMEQIDELQKKAES